VIASVAEVQGQLLACEEKCRELLNEASAWAAEREQLQAQLARARKMEALGILAEGTAHQFNNLLSIVVTYASFALEALPPGDAIRKDLEHVAESGSRAVELTRQLLMLGQQQLRKIETINLNATLNAMVPQLRRRLGERIGLALLLAPALGKVRADADQVEQLILSLVSNACEAMPDGGTLTLQTANVPSAALGAGQLPTAATSAVKLTVCDTGCGIAPGMLARIFEPFVTTKRAGDGNGLGLAAVLAIVREGGGNVEVHSAPGSGTTVEITLPCAAESASSTPPLARAGARRAVSQSGT
jgi:two-component system cell cycle sensor histidine kinase/response regulator CckA